MQLRPVTVRIFPDVPDAVKTRHLKTDDPNERRPYIELPLNENVKVGTDQEGTDLCLSVKNGPGRLFKFGLRDDRVIVLDQINDNGRSVLLSSRPFDPNGKAIITPTSGLSFFNITFPFGSGEETKILRLRVEIRKAEMTTKLEVVADKLLDMATQFSGADGKYQILAPGESLGSVNLNRPEIFTNRNQTSAYLIHNGAPVKEYTNNGELWNTFGCGTRNFMTNVNLGITEFANGELAEVQAAEDATPASVVISNPPKKEPPAEVKPPEEAAPSASS